MSALITTALLSEASNVKVTHYERIKPYLPMKQKTRVLHAPTTVGGNAQNLSNVLNTLGLESKSCALSQNYLNYHTDQVVWNEGDSLFLREWKRFKAIKSALKFDVIHFNAGTSFACPIAFPNCDDDNTWSWRTKLIRAIWSTYTNTLQLIELNLLALFRKPIFITYQGDDARQGDYSLENFEINIASQVDAGYYSASSDDYKRYSIKRMSKYCEQVYALNPDLLHVLPHHAKFIPYSHILLNEWEPCFTQDSHRPLRILHAPSHRKVKGTDMLLEVFNKLKAQNYDFELILVEGLSNEEAKKLYQTADILIDQLYAGWYGGLAVELMALGKPVMAYIRESDLVFIPNEMRKDLPIIRTSPHTLENDLKALLETPRESLVSIAKKSRAYVEKWHDPIRIASLIKTDYEHALMRKRK